MSLTIKHKSTHANIGQAMINVGLITDGKPLIEPRDGGFRLRNLLIGEGFIGSVS